MSLLICGWRGDHNYHLAEGIAGTQDQHPSIWLQWRTGCPGQAATDAAHPLPFLLKYPHVLSAPGLPWIQRPVGRGSCPNSPHSSDRTQLPRGGEGTLDKTVKHRLSFVYLICLTQFPGPTGRGSELGGGVRKGEWFPSVAGFPRPMAVALGSPTQGL